jgi:hypothetical protein
VADRLSPISGRSSKRHWTRPLGAGLIAMAFLAAGCGGGGDGEVEITYRQLAYFPSYEATPGSPSTPGANGAYILYRITEVDNQSGNTFTLNPNRFISKHDQETKEHAAHEVPLLGDRLLEPTDIEAGDTAEDLGCMVMVVRVDDANETFGNFGGTVTSVDLEYEETASGQAKTTREEGNTGFRILEPANPETVQRECAEGES